MEIPFLHWFIPIVILIPLPILLLETILNYISISLTLSKTIFKSYSKNNSKLPPGPPKLPFIGNLHQLASKSTPPRRLQELAGRYGPIMGVYLGEVYTVVVSSAEWAKELLQTHDTNFANRAKLLAGEVTYYKFTDIALAPYGEYWRQARKLATLELFTAKRVQSFRAIREEEVGHFINSIALQAHGASLVNLSDKIFDLGFTLTSRAVFKKKGVIDVAALRTLVANVSKASSGFTIEDIYPSMKFLHRIFGKKRKLERLVQEWNNILDPIIHAHISNMSRPEKTDENLIDALLKLYHYNTLAASHFSFSVDNIKSITLEIYDAGSETSSTTLDWAMSELLRSPSAMEKAQQEVRRVYNGKDTIDETNLKALKYLNSVIKETLRLHPPVSLLVPRESIEECQIRGYNIPSKTRVLVNVHAIGRDPKHWKNPNVFEPERFEESSIEYKGNDFELIPFGAGRRMCPGMKLGMANVELPLAMLLYHFDWKLPIGIKAEELDMDELFGTTMRRKNDLYVIPTPYSPRIV